ncbi:beta-1,4-mannosyl-glycoprotein 4-beta-N-acetylglucosaminyltransferase [Bradysia coprophila]|uniref:beta-1,4-mannosyl-glycoprotein 4-beta-N-acetylglucosaminyltransferase n=1 Tax=Bradysia coprophila TaxID=38358 RepID=UPI00187D8A65|nr:beta-1,4-mannosyl-glycoprotein 4-beta-N-acetylglucosaminyltransferase [Bradysia coprophila]
MYLLERRICDKKAFLWSIFTVQLILIAAVVLIFGSWNTNELFEIDGNVKFVKNYSENAFTNGVSELSRRNNDVRRIDKNGDFSKEFINSSLEDESLCFRDGIEPGDDNSICKCKSDYHGRDCGQPEVLWRAFMTSKIPLNLALPRREPHKIIYFIQATIISMETLKIQIMELNEIVDLFVLCDSSVTRDQSFRLNATEFLKQMDRKILVLSDRKCTPKVVYKKFRRGVGGEKGVTADDVVLFSNSDEILNWRAVKYFKWYDNWPQPVRFRLKYTVYGYYWQHPQNTIIGSAACQISMLEEIFKGDPARMTATKKSGMIVGDLNYVGGWFCQYCYHPLEIVKKLLQEEKDVFLDDKKVIDPTYIEHLIGNGLYVDGKIGLTRLHRFSGKCYAPDFVSTGLSWRYQHILTNVYATYDDYENE